MWDIHHEIDDRSCACGAYETGIGLPQVEEWERDEVLDEIDEIIEGYPVQSEQGEMPLSEVPHVNAIFDIVGLLELLLKDEPDQIPLFRIAELAVMCGYPSLPDTAALQIAFGRETGIAQRTSLLSLITEAKINEKSPDDYIAELHARGELGDNRMARCFRGEVSDAPSAERIRRGINMLRRVLALVPAWFRVGPLCTLAWLHWANGKRAIALRHLVEAQDIEPDHVTVCALARHLSTRTPAWVDG